MAEEPPIDPQQALKAGDWLDELLAERDRQLVVERERIDAALDGLAEARAEVVALKAEVVALKSAAPPTSEAIQAAVRAEVDEQMKLLILEKLTLTDEQKLKLDEILRPAGEDAVA